MNEAVQKQNTVNQGKNVKFAREFRGLTQDELAFKINKHQSDISRYESSLVVEEEILNRIALALEVDPNFLKSFDFGETSKSFINHSTNTINTNDNAQDDINLNQGEQNYYFSAEEFNEINDKFLKLQKEMLEEKYVVEKENALLKQELEFLKNKK